MTYCKTCGEPIQTLPFHCKRCDENFCDEHRLPELHDCLNMPAWWHNRGKNVIPTRQLDEMKVIFHTLPTYSEEEAEAPTVLTP